MAADGSTAVEELNKPRMPAHWRREAAAEAEAIETVMPQEVRGINLLQLAPALYMYQVYDRVLSTQHIETLVAITIVTVLALVLLAALDGARNAVGMRLGS